MELTIFSKQKNKETTVCICGNTNCKLLQSEYCKKSTQLQEKLLNAVESKSLKELDRLLCGLDDQDKNWWGRYWRFNGRVYILGLAKASRDWERIQASKLSSSSSIPSGLVETNEIIQRLKRFNDRVNRIMDSPDTMSTVIEKK